MLVQNSGPLREQPADFRRLPAGQRLIRVWDQRFPMGLDRESMREMRRDVEENPELYEALADDPDEDEVDEE